MTDTEGGTVLVVDDDSDVVRTYRAYLDDAFTVRTARDGVAALDAVDETVDVVLLDRRMPGLSGRQVLERIRDRGLGVRVAMVTAVDPDFDVVNMGFDDYVTKPTTPAALRETVDTLVAMNRHAEDVREYHSLLSTVAALREGALAGDPRESDAYADLEARVAALGARLEARAERLTDDTAFVATLRAIDAATRGGDTDG